MNEPLDIKLRKYKDSLMTSGTAVIIVMIVMYLLICAVYLSIRLYVGLSARKEAKGRKKGSAYLILAGMIALLLLAVIVAQFYTFFTAEGPGIDTAAVTMLLDVTSLFAVLDMIISALLSRKTTKILESRGLPAEGIGE